MKKKIVIMFAGTSILFSGSYMFLNLPPSMMQDEIFTIKPGESLISVSENLKNNNLIKNEYFFRMQSYIQMKKYIRTGRYKIFKGMTAGDIFRRLSSGDIITKKIIIPEGFNIYQIAERLDAGHITDSGKFLFYSFNREFLTSLKIESSSAEGYLFPDTYIFPEDSDARDVILLMHNKMKNLLKKIIISRNKSHDFNIQRLLILASLVEKEAKIPHERNYISSVFHNRLKRNMRMDCDPTVRYAVKNFKGKITYNDLKYDSPFNTYVNKGLPPTPICSPGKASILAAIRPKNTSYLYFVARNDGSHYFSKSLREHNKAVRFYQKNIKNGFIDMQNLR